MVNIDDFTKRLEKLFDFYGLSPSSFADKIGVQRSSLSHLLSGRNRPSLDFVLKVTEVFPEVDLYWILLGKGNFPKNEIQKQASPTLFSTPAPAEKSKNESPAIVKNEIPLKFSENNSEIEKIVVFYKNGTFKSYNEREW